MPSRSAPWSQRTSLLPLIRLQVTNAAADAFVVVGLADTLFFGVPVGQARGRVALYLLVTMAPFALVAPVIGPLLDRFRGGRRTAIAVAMLGRAVLAWAMAGGGGGLALYPAAFGVLVLSKGYGVTRSAAVPRLLPDGLTLVGANARLSAAALAGGTAGGLLSAALTALSDYRWSLRVGGSGFLVATAFALMLPRQVNGTTEGVLPEHVRAPRSTPAIRSALLGAVTLRALAGFLTTFLAFLLRRRGGGTLDIGLVAAAAAAGGFAGTALGGLFRHEHPRLLLLGAQAGCAVGCALGAIRFGLLTAMLVTLVCALGGALGKLSLDAVLQQELPEAVQGQGFARAETTLQLAWVAGGAIGIALPLWGGLGLGLAAAGVTAGTVAALRVERPAIT